MFDLIIRNGHLMDPRCNLDKQADIGIKGRHIVDIGNLEGKECLQSVDAKGCLVVPGLIDFHAHAAYGISDFLCQPISYRFQAELHLWWMLDPRESQILRRFITVILLPV